MPMYDYECDTCGALVEVVVRYEDRDLPRACECARGGTMTRVWTRPPATRAPDHQTAVVLGSGETVKGNFGGGYRVKKRTRKYED